MDDARTCWRSAADHLANFVTRLLQVSYITRPDNLRHLYKEDDFDARHSQVTKRHRDRWDQQDFDAGNLVFKPGMGFNKSYWQEVLGYRQDLFPQFHHDRLLAQLEEWLTKGI